MASTSVSNALSVARIPLSVAILAIYSSRDKTRFGLAMVLIAAAVVTDILDGFLARRSRTASELGYILDGLGDRAAYVSLILVLVASGYTSLVVGWILIFREILIYALRVLTPSWYSFRQSLRVFSKLHAAGIRIWIASFLAADALKLYLSMDLRSNSWYETLQRVVLIATIIVAYFGLARQGLAMIQRNSTGGDLQAP